MPAKIQLLSGRATAKIIGPTGTVTLSARAKVVAVSGAQGPSGPPGATGATGPTGPQGPTGEEATPITSVSDDGSGNLTINTASASYGPFALKGPAGDDGAQGPQGPSGSEGPQGPAGTEATPITGISDDGNGNLTINTASSSYGPFALKGPAGSTGSTGPQGPTGAEATPITGISDDGNGNLTINTASSSYGPFALKGPPGNDGSTGGEGPQGPAGTEATPITGISDDGNGNLTINTASSSYGPFALKGPAGNDGAQGAQGPQGPAGTEATPITSISNDGSGNLTIYTSSSSYGPFALMGPPGSTGGEGPAGATGPEGPQGPQGPQGDPGQDALWNFTGAYSGGSAYAVGDVATYNGGTFYRTNSNGGNVGDTPGENAFWTTVSAKGDTGDAGATGDTGPTGATGATGPAGAAGADGADGADGAGVEVAATTSNIIDSSATLADVDGMSFSIAANEKVTAIFQGFWATSVSGSGFKYSFSGPGSPTFVQIGDLSNTSATAVRSESGMTSFSPTTATQGGATLLNTAMPIMIQIYVANGSTPGTVQLKMGGEVNGSNFTLYKGFTMQVLRIP